MKERRLLVTIRVADDNCSCCQHIRGAQGSRDATCFA